MRLFNIRYVYKFKPYTELVEARSSVLAIKAIQGRRKESIKVLNVICYNIKSHL